MSINNTITITGYDPATGIQHTVRGTGTTRAAALAELQARAALEVLVKQKGTESMALVDADYAATVFATGAFADAELTLTKGIGYTDKVIRLPNTTTAVLLAGSKGQINIANGLITNFAAAYQDGDGVGGYVPLRGKFTE
jgi:hypothetical protein